MLSNIREIKKHYLEELKDTKNPHHLTPEKYLSSSETPLPASQPSSHPQSSGMFQPAG
ncbi:MAG: hypothetical protein LBD75_03740 [Candidatus Peribacteria bacterium]|jgi:hypothetical protein|nr:hypothetical protein [Candidatus Peribacteria bacterium]